MSEGTLMESTTDSIGLIHKYNVTRVDGRQDSPDADYFILKLGKGNKYELAAIKAYAESCKHDYPELAKDLMEKYFHYRGDL